jgi:hypothetical protein
MKPKIIPLGDSALLIQFGDEIVLTRYKPGDDEAVMPFITSANIACGFHAAENARLIRDTLSKNKILVEAILANLIILYSVTRQRYH